MATYLVMRINSQNRQEYLGGIISLRTRMLTALKAPYARYAMKLPTQLEGADAVGYKAKLMCIKIPLSSTMLNKGLWRQRQRTPNALASPKDLM